MFFGIKRQILVVALFLFSSFCTLSSAQSSEKMWEVSEMTKAHMSQLTKWQCVEKTKITMLAGCSKREECIKNMAGLLGDCVSYAKGDHQEFCSNFRQWRIQTCMKNEIDARTCAFFEIGQKPLCEANLIK